MKSLTTKLLGGAALVFVLGLAPAAAQVTLPGGSGGGAGVQGGAQGGADIQGGTGGGAGVQGGTGGGADIQGGAQGGANVQGGAEVQGGAQQGQSGATVEGQGGADVQGKGSARTGQSGADVQTEGKASGEAKTGTSSSEGSQEKEGTAQDRTRGETSGQAKSGSSTESTTRITSKQKTEIKQYFSKNKVRVKPVEKSRVNVSIGINVPTFVALHPLPSTIIVSRSDCPYHYFVWGDDLVIVESCNRRVVEIIVGVA